MFVYLDLEIPKPQTEQVGINVLLIISFETNRKENKQKRKKKIERE